MKLTKFLPIIVLAFGLSACNKPAGELVGAYTVGPVGDVDPYGMRFIRKGSFLMGPNEQSAIFTQSDNNVMVTVHAFWMDETEITNSEYRQFVNWVRDSLAYMALIGEDGVESEYALKPRYEREDAPVHPENAFSPDPLRKPQRGKPCYKARRHHAQPVRKQVKPHMHARHPVYKAIHRRKPDR